MVLIGTPVLGIGTLDETPSSSALLFFTPSHVSSPNSLLAVTRSLCTLNNDSLGSSLSLSLSPILATLRSSITEGEREGETSRDALRQMASRLALPRSGCGPSREYRSPLPSTPSVQPPSSPPTQEFKFSFWPSKFSRRKWVSAAMATACQLPSASSCVPPLE